MLCYFTTTWRCCRAFTNIVTNALFALQLLQLNIKLLAMFIK